jgi:hypothetical protein
MVFFTRIRGISPRRAASHRCSDGHFLTMAANERQEAPKCVMLLTKFRRELATLLAFAKCAEIFLDPTRAKCSG